MHQSPYNGELAKALSALSDCIDATLLPNMTEAERQHLKYFHRRAPGCTIGVETKEAIIFAQAMS